MKKNLSMFLQQSCLDAWEDYLSSLRMRSFTGWDAVILTASDEKQAEGYRLQLERRMQGGHLPRAARYLVLPDPDGRRIGSGGATLNALRALHDQAEDKDNPFEGKRVLVIHSGGDSKRAPQYSACGKLFSPVPRMLPDGRRSTMFDELIIATAGIPARMKDGMLLMSGDVLLVLNPLQIDFGTGGVAGISVKENVETGKNHGVYLQGEDHFVARFLHKMSAQGLRGAGAVDEEGSVNIDTGAVLMDSAFLSDLFSVVCSGGGIDEGKWARFTDEATRLNFYGDFLYPLAEASTPDEYEREGAEVPLNDRLLACRRDLWSALRAHRMRLISLSPALFLHFGTTRELLGMNTDKTDELQFLGWTPRVLCRDTGGDYACGNSLVEDGADIAQGCYLEDSVVGALAKVGPGCVLSGVTLKDVSIPAGTVVHGLRLRDGRFVARVYRVDDNPKDSAEDGSFLGEALGKLAGLAGARTLWPEGEEDLWNALLFPARDTMEEAVRASLLLLDVLQGDEDALHAWKAGERFSLRSSFLQADAAYALDWQADLEREIRARIFLDGLEARKPLESLCGVFGPASAPADGMIRRVEDMAGGAPLGARMRAFYGMATLLRGDESRAEERERLESRCFEELQSAVMKETFLRAFPCAGAKIQKEEASVALPLRVNFGGGWSDTPPYCYENGGTVLNAAVSLNGVLPVRVKMRRVDRPVVILESADSGMRDTFDTIGPLRDHSNPFDPFALHKAALLACGVVPMEGNAGLGDLLGRIGGGFCLSTEMIGIPRGSGLGTSSILAGACVQAVLSFFGAQADMQEQYERVLCAEQIMGTGGGWQDQIGGMTPGVKFITTRPGLRQEFRVEQVGLSSSTARELNGRLVLINTGQRRLARNLLREIMGRYVNAVPEAVDALRDIQRLAALMKFELERDDVDAFAELLDRHWALSKQLDASSTNTCIDQIFASCDHLLAGKMICGAGGGGFLQAVLKKDVSKEELRQTLRGVFGESGVDVWECELVL